ncbi:MAG: hypothetical protein C0619_00250 [Desulfuromonas sp.]|nr:MAG: hypothetical protein C0619_00250 [Desulfuromonas sp.]
MPMPPKDRFILWITILVVLAGCGTLPDGRRWGDGVTLRPGWNRVGAAAREAVLAPQTWAPLTGAALFRLTNWDQDVSDWAIEHHPIFGSNANARAKSITLHDTTAAIWGITVLAAPGGKDVGPWLTSKARGVMVQGAAMLTAQGITEGLKSATNRPRPDRWTNNDNSFPSGHATSAASLATFAYHNLETLALSETEKLAAGIGLGALTAVNGWVRIEAFKHYPSDVLTGIALGYFISEFFNNAFLGLDEYSSVRPGMEFSSDNVMVGLSGNF